MADELPLSEHTLKGKAAVLLVLSREGGDLRLLLTRRTKTLSAHAGEVALPGGKWEAGDADLYATALRETWEEVGIPPRQLVRVAALKAERTRRGVEVCPFIAEWGTPGELQLCQHEIESAQWFDLEFLRRDQRVCTQVFPRHSPELWAPVYEIGGYQVWGLTSRVLVSFANDYLGLSLNRQHSAPEEIFTG